MSDVNTDASPSIDRARREDRTFDRNDWPHFGQEEIDAATSVLRSGNVNYWTGEHGRVFEKEFAQFIGVQHAVAVANGTVALELALAAAGVGAGDEVITSSRTFIASASAIVAQGAIPVVADVDPVSQNVTADALREVLTERTRALVVVHLAGWPCDMDPIMRLAEEFDLFVVEDCAQALGATYKGRQVGSIGDIGAFSFCQDKIMTTAGEGGMITLDDETLWKKAWARKDHGKDYDLVHDPDPSPGFRWLHESFGTNLRMTEVQAAVGRVALRKVPAWIQRRKRLASIFQERFSDIVALRITKPPDAIGHAYYKYYAFVRSEHLRPGWDRDRILHEIGENGIPAFSGSCSEIYLEKAFVNAGLGPKQRHPVAKELGETSLMFQVHPTLSEAAIHDACAVVEQVMHEATRT